MIKIATIDKSTGKFQVQNLDYLHSWKKNAQDLIWVDIDSEPEVTERDILENQFGINTLAVDDALRDRHPPKLEWFEGYFFLLLKAFNAQSTSTDFGILHISFFVGDHFLITRRTGTSPSIEKVWNKHLSLNLTKGRGAYYTTYQIVRTIIDRYTPFIYQMETRLDQLEELMLENPSDILLGELIKYNATLKKLRRIFGYQNTVLSSLAHSKLVTTHPQRIHEFQDIREQIDRLESLSSLLQELTKDLIDGYISVTSHRLNKIMKVLTIVTVFFLPLTFMAGIYGMNFEHMPELKYQNAYFTLIGIMGTSVLVLLILFKKIKWI